MIEAITTMKNYILKQYLILIIKMFIFKSIEKPTIEKMFKDGNLDLTEKHYYSDFGYMCLEELCNINDNPNLYDHLPFYDLNNRPLSKH